MNIPDITQETKTQQIDILKGIKSHISSIPSLHSWLKYNLVDLLDEKILEVNNYKIKCH